MSRSSCIVAACVVLALAIGAPAANKGPRESDTLGGNMGQIAPEFPPGAFSDGGSYQLGAFRGKVVVLFFYEQDCPTCRGTIPGRNKVVEQFHDKPIKFIAVGPDSASDVKAYIAQTKLAMPVFVDNLHLMETAYLAPHTPPISMNNIFQIRVIGPDGHVCGYDMDPAKLSAIVDQVKWKYKDDGYDPSLTNIIDLLEWNQFETALPQLARLRKSSSKTVAASAEKLYQAVKFEAQQWKDDADKAVDSNPAAAYDLYTKVVTCFDKEDIGKAAADALKKLKTNKTLNNELAARQMYQRIYSAIPQMQLNQRDQVTQFCDKLVAQFADTPTAAKAVELSKMVAAAEAVPHAK